MKLLSTDINEITCERRVVVVEEGRGGEPPAGAGRPSRRQTSRTMARKLQPTTTTTGEKLRYISITYCQTSFFIPYDNLYQMFAYILMKFHESFM